MSPQNETAARALLDDLHGVEAARRALGANESERCDDPQWAVELLGGLDAAGLALIRKAAASAMGGGGDEIRDSLLGRSLTRAARLRPAVLLDDPRSLGESDLRLLALILPQPLTPEQADQWSERLLPIAASEDSGVRVGLLRLLAAIRPPNLERILFLALEDREGQVRMMAAELIGECIGAKALQPLLQVLLSSGFEQREYEEQAAFYIALAQASPPEVLPLLEKTIGRRSWLAPRHWRVQKACALRALSWIPIEKAGPILMKYRNSQDPLLAEASREALERHRCSLNGEHGAVRRGA